jgi:C-terminal processing protease CtpA/Prc
MNIRLSLLALLTFAPVLPVQAQQTTVSGTVRTRATQFNEDEIIRLVNELRAREARLLRELANTPADDIVARRNLEQQLARVSREAFSVMSVIESRCGEQQAAVSNGYLGVTITSEYQARDRNAEIVGRTMITSVEPGSPAEAAGIHAEDRLLSVGGRDARNDLPRLSDLLQPGRRLPVVVERDGKPMEFMVTVAPRPQRMRTACPEFERAMQPLRMGSVARVWVRDSADDNGNRVVTILPAPSIQPGPPMPGTPPAVRAPLNRGSAPNPPTPPSPPTPPAATAPLVFLYGVTNGATSEIAYFNGAQFRSLDDDWRSVLGVRNGTDGVLVNEVAAGSAAAAAGLKSGDVVLSVDGTIATSPLVLARLLSLTDADQSTLRVWRARDTRTVTIRRNAERTPRP